MKQTMRQLKVNARNWLEFEGHNKGFKTTKFNLNYIQVTVSTSNKYLHRDKNERSLIKSNLSEKL